MTTTAAWGFEYWDRGTMNLRFVALNNAVVPIPGARYITGQRAPRLGMRWDGAAGRYVSTGRPHEVKRTDPAVVALCKMARAGDIVPADAETAAAVGVAYRPVEYPNADSGWVLAEAE